MATEKEKTNDEQASGKIEKKVAPVAKKKTQTSKSKTTPKTTKAVKTPEKVSKKEEPVMKKEEKPKQSTKLDRGPILLGGGLLLLGLVLLLGELFGFRFGSVLWPFIFIIPGAMIFISALTSDDTRGEGFAILGAMMTTLGAMFFLQSVFRMWASWAYAWSLLAPTSIGAAQVVYGIRKERENLVENGKKLMQVGLTMFAVFFIFFEIILGISGVRFIPFGLPALPVGLILLGFLIVLRAFFNRK